MREKDEQLCDVCGREVADWDEPDQQPEHCWRPVNRPGIPHEEPSAECYRLGYEREKARADAAWDAAIDAVIKAHRDAGIWDWDESLMRSLRHGRAEPPAGPPDASARVLELEKEKLEWRDLYEHAEDRAETAEKEKLELTRALRAARAALFDTTGEWGQDMANAVAIIDAALTSGTAPRSAAAPPDPSAAAATEEAK